MGSIHYSHPAWPSLWTVPTAAPLAGWCPAPAATIISLGLRPSTGRLRGHAGARPMRLDAIAVGNDPPHDINVIIEVPVGGEPIKYEMDKACGHAGGRPLPLHADALPRKLRLRAPYSVRRRRPDRRARLQHARDRPRRGDQLPARRRACHGRRGRRRREDHRRAEQQADATLRKVANYSDLPGISLEQIEHFFAHYKDLEPDKWVKIDHWGDAAEAHRLIGEAIARANSKPKS